MIAGLLPVAEERAMPAVLATEIPTVHGDRLIAAAVESMALVTT
ncbi:hypothetical protein ACWKSP_41420 [Micromonosporaceae bacterium Da 78-11]